MPLHLVRKTIDVVIIDNSSNADLRSPSHTQYFGIDFQDTASVVHRVNYNLSIDPSVVISVIHTHREEVMFGCLMKEDISLT